MFLSSDLGGDMVDPEIYYAENVVGSQAYESLRKSQLRREEKRIREHQKWNTLAILTLLVGLLTYGFFFGGFSGL